MKKFLVRLFISLIIGGGMLYLAAHNLALEGTWETLCQAKWIWLIPFCLVMAVQHFFRSWRWNNLLDPIHHVPFGKVLAVSSVGFFAILALPLRMGEFVRPYLIAERPNLRISHGLGTLAVERIFDGLVLSLAAFACIAIASTKTYVPYWIDIAGIISLVLFVVALVVLIMTLWQKERAVTLCHRMFSLISPRIADRAASLAEGIVDGFKVLPDFRRLIAFIFHTIVYWFLNAISIWILAFAFDLDLSIEGSISFTALVGIGIMIPAGPGFIGNFELFAEGALGLYIPTTSIKATATAFILATHVTNALWYIVTGLLAMFSPHASFARVWHASTTVEKSSTAESIPANQQ